MFLLQRHQFRFHKRTVAIEGWTYPGASDLSPVMFRERSVLVVSSPPVYGLYWMWRNGREYSPSLEFGSHAGKLGTGNGGQ